jgi:hypothetical protein
VEDDVPHCHIETSTVCPTDNFTGKEVCSDISHEVCSVNQQTNTKMSQETDCHKRPREVCGAAVCPITRGADQCNEEVKKVSIAMKCGEMG